MLAAINVISSFNYSVHLLYFFAQSTLQWVLPKSYAGIIIAIYSYKFQSATQYPWENRIPQTLFNKHSVIHYTRSRLSSAVIVIPFTIDFSAHFVSFIVSAGAIGLLIAEFCWRLQSCRQNKMANFILSMLIQIKKYAKNRYAIKCN